MFTRSLLVCAAVSLLPGCPLVDAEVDTGEVCLTQRGVALDVPAASGTYQTSFAVDDLSAAQALAQLGSTVSFVRANVHATDGLDLGFVTAARVDIASGDPMSALPVLTAFDCEGDCAPSGASLELLAPDQADVMAYVKSNSLVVDLTLTGSTPAQHVTVDIDVCMAAHASYSVTP